MSRASAITSGDIPDERFRSAHVSPIAGEVSAEVLGALRPRVEVLSLDPQGLVRGFDEEGRVYGKSWRDSKALGLVDVLKASPEELRLITGFVRLHRGLETLHNVGVDVVIITLGSRGSLVSVSGEVYHIPACKSRCVIDPTGAGDAYMGAFLAEYVRGGDAPWCGCMGSAVASLMVETPGPNILDDMGEIVGRAHGAWESTRRVDVGSWGALSF